MDPLSIVEISYKVKESSDSLESLKTSVKVYQYTEKSMAISIEEKFGKSFANSLKEIGGKFNPKLSIGKGWIFPVSKFNKVQELFGKINTFEILGEPVVEYEKKTASLDGILGNISAPPPLVTNVKTFLSKLNSFGEEPVVYNEGNKVYIFGLAKDVAPIHNNYTDKSVALEINTKTHSFVIFE